MAIERAHQNLTLSDAIEDFHSAQNDYYDNKGLNESARQALKLSDHSLRIEYQNDDKLPALKLTDHLEQFIQTTYRIQLPFRIECISFGTDTIVIEHNFLPHWDNEAFMAKNEAHMQFIFANHPKEITCYAFGGRVRHFDEEVIPVNETPIQETLRELRQDMKDCPPSILRDFSSLLRNLKDNDSTRLRVK